jgi:hypothetical protein
LEFYGAWVGAATSYLRLKVFLSQFAQGVQLWIALYPIPAHGSLGTALPNFRDAHAPVWLPAHRHPVHLRSGVQAGAESVAAPLVYADARNVEVLTDLQPVDAGRDLAVPARLLNAWTDVGVPQRDAVFVAARGIDNLTMRYGTVRLDPVAPPPTVGGRRVVDLLAVAV